MGQTGCTHVHTKGTGDEIDQFVSEKKIKNEENVEKDHQQEGTVIRKSVTFEKKITDNSLGDK